MVQLPFLDDIRMPEADPNWVGEGHPTPDEAAVDAAADMIAALQLPDYFSGSVANPSLQRHYQVPSWRKCQSVTLRTKQPVSWRCNSGCC